MRYVSHSMARVGRAKKKKGTVAVIKSVGRYLGREPLQKAFLQVRMSHDTNPSP